MQLLAAADEIGQNWCSRDCSSVRVVQHFRGVSLKLPYRYVAVYFSSKPVIPWRKEHHNTRRHVGRAERAAHRAPKRLTSEIKQAHYLSVSGGYNSRFALVGEDAVVAENLLRKEVEVS